MMKKPIEQLCRCGTSNLLQKNLEADSGPHPVFGAAGEITRIAFCQEDKPYIGVVKDGAGIGRAMRLPGHSSTIGTMMRLVPFEGTDLGYLFHAFQSLRLAEHRTGSTIPHIYFRDFKNTLLPCPSIYDQRKIAERFDVVCELIEKRNSQLAQLDTLAKSLFVEMFGDPVENPKGWKVSALKDAAAIKSGSTLPATIENEGGPVLYCKVADLNLPGNEKWITTSSRAVSFPTAGNGVFPVGTVIFPKNGGDVGTNKKRLSVRPTCVDLNTMGVSPDPAKLESEFLFQLFQFVDLATLAVGTTVPQISAKNMGAKQIYLPPLPLQRAFAKRIEAIDKSKFAIRKSLDELNRLYRSLLQQYFG